MTLKESQPNEATVVAILPQYLAAIHNHIFSLGLLICLRRRTINPRPRQLLPYTTALFSAVALFMALSSGSSKSRYSVAGPTIRPIFYAAVELFRLEDQHLVRAVWLDRIESTAIGNRTAIRAMIEKICEIRRQRAELSTQGHECTPESARSDSEATGDIIIDWKSITKVFNEEFLLV